MNCTSSQPDATRWLAENGPKELELLFRAIVYHPSAPILIADDDRHYREASVGAARVLGLSRAEIIGRRLDDFAEPSLKPLIPERWDAFLDQGELEGTLQFVGPDGGPRQLDYTAKGSVLPVRHLVVLREKTPEMPGGNPAEVDENGLDNSIPAWVQDYALFLLDASGRVAAWYAGAERIYGYSSEEVMGEHESFFYSREEAMHTLEEKLTRAVNEGHVGSEGWHVKKDGSRFWANVLTMALKDENGDLQGFARVVRDFSDRHERDDELRRRHARLQLIPDDSTIAGVVSGEFDGIPEANDAFLGLVGYTREDLLAGRLRWPDLTPPEYISLDELAHEDGLRFGACTPYQKELIRKDGTRIPVLVATAVLKLSPFRWISFVQDLRGRARPENVEPEKDGGTPPFDQILGSSVVMKRLMERVVTIAPTDATVLITGEPSTGKELIARTIHRMSPRRNFPFITLNCSTIQPGLLESELFGHERGAFTGALSQKTGHLELAHRGTLFLKDVGSISLDLQPKLLRALDERSFQRLGGTRAIPIDVRIIAATHRSLPQMVEDHLFRSDLYYRLNVFPISTPPLRERSEDVPILARHFTKKHSAKLDRPIEKIPSDTIRALVNWTWPGNLAELENFIERSVLLSRGSVLRAPVAELGGHGEAAGTATLEEMERDYILRVFRDTGGVISSTALRLGLPRTTLNAMMKKLEISRSDL